MPKQVSRKRLIRVGVQAISLIMIGALASACLPDTDSSVADMIGIRRINQDIALLLFEPETQPVGLNRPIHFMLRNQSSSIVRLPPDYGHQVLAYSTVSGKWEEIENRTHYVPEDQEVILNPSGDLLRDEAGFSILPVVDSPRDFSILRVIVIGEADSGGKVAAYIDLELAD